MKSILKKDQQKEKGKGWEKEKYVCPQIEVLEMECEQLLVDSSTGASINRMNEGDSNWE